MKKFSYLLLIIFIFLFPICVFASSGTDNISIGEALFIEAFVSAHMSLFVFVPLSKLISFSQYKKVFWLLFIARVIFLLSFDFFVSTFVSIFDFFMVFIGFFIVYILSISVENKKGKKISSNFLQDDYKLVDYTHDAKYCSKCGNRLSIRDSYCRKCGKPIDS